MFGILKNWRNTDSAQFIYKKKQIPSFQKLRSVVCSLLALSGRISSPLLWKNSHTLPYNIFLWEKRISVLSVWHSSSFIHFAAGISWWEFTDLSTGTQHNNTLAESLTPRPRRGQKWRSSHNYCKRETDWLTVWIITFTNYIATVFLHSCSHYGY